MKKENAKEQKTQKAGPAFVKRIGNVKASVFKNEGGESGKVYFNIAVVRRYRANDGAWHDTNVLNGTADGLAAVECLRLAIDFVNANESSETTLDDE